MIKTLFVNNILLFENIDRGGGMDIDYKQVFARMLKAGNLKNSSEMARVLGMTPQAISNHKRRDELSAGFIIKFAQKCDISVDWLLTGYGEPSVREKSASRLTPLRGQGGVVGMAEELERESDCNGNVGSSKEKEHETNSCQLCPEEIIYVGKLLKLLRSSEKRAPLALKASIDAIMWAVYPDSAPPPQW